MPLQMEMRNKNSVYKIELSDKTELDYEDASYLQFHFIGSFKGYTIDGNEISSGKFTCYISI